MATSSFSKTFVFNSEAVKKVQSVQKQSGTKVPSPVTDRVKEGKEALARFSSPSKKYWRVPRQEIIKTLLSRHFIVLSAIKIPMFKVF